MPVEVCLIHPKWIYEIKLGSPPGYEAHIVARGDQEEHDVYYYETFAHTVHWKLI